MNQSEVKTKPEEYASFRELAAVVCNLETLDDIMYQLFKVQDSRIQDLEDMVCKLDADGSDYNSAIQLFETSISMLRVMRMINRYMDETAAGLNPCEDQSKFNSIDLKSMIKANSQKVEHENLQQVLNDVEGQQDTNNETTGTDLNDKGLVKKNQTAQ